MKKLKSREFLLKTGKGFLTVRVIKYSNWFSREVVESLEFFIDNPVLSRGFELASRDAFQPQLLLDSLGFKFKII